jgi:hypothetical protein
MENLNYEIEIITVLMFFFLRRLVQVRYTLTFNSTLKQWEQSHEQGIYT